MIFVSSKFSVRSALGYYPNDGRLIEDDTDTAMTMSKPDATKVLH
jgi:hypothetical protein